MIRARSGARRPGLAAEFERAVARKSQGVLTNANGRRLRCRRRRPLRQILDARRLFRGRDLDLDQHARIGELGLDAGARRQVLAAVPVRPGLVHGLAVADVG